MELHFFRDASNRLTHDREDIESGSYPEFCKKIADKFQLKPTSKLIIGPDLMFWDFSDGIGTIELGWDPWMGFMVTANGAEEEALVRQISLFLAKIVPHPQPPS